MEELTRGVRELHQRVAHLDDLLHEHRGAADLRERLANAAHEQAEHNRGRISRLTVALVVGLLIWTPCTAYGAVWIHELIRNTCYPEAVWVPPVPPAAEQDQPWVCGLFPGTGRHRH